MDEVCEKAVSEAEETVLHLLSLPQENFDLERRLFGGRTFLHMLAEKGMCEAAKKVVLEHGMHLMELRCDRGKRPIVDAVAHAQPSVARFFLEQYRAQGQLQAVLYTAVEGEDGKVYPLLFYAIYGIKSKYAEEPHDEKKQLEVTRLLVNEFGVAFYPQAESLESSIHSEGKLRYLPLYSAASEGHASIVDFLISECGLATDLRTPEGKMTPLHCACLH
jgi:hypothetical protein